MTTTTVMMTNRASAARRGKRSEVGRRLNAITDTGRMIKTSRSGGIALVKGNLMAGGIFKTPRMRRTL
jgi:hypothetical protein